MLSQNLLRTSGSFKSLGFGFNFRFGIFKTACFNFVDQTYVNFFSLPLLGVPFQAPAPIQLEFQRNPLSLGYDSDFTFVFDDFLFFVWFFFLTRSSSRLETFIESAHFLQDGFWNGNSKYTIRPCVITLFACCGLLTKRGPLVLLLQKNIDLSLLGEIVSHTLQVHQT